MKKILLFTFCLSSIILRGQTNVLSEDFNNGLPANWLLIDNDGAAPYNDPLVNFINDAFVINEDYDSTGTGDSILIATSWLDPITDADDYLILPSVSLGSGGNILYFDTKSIDQSYPDGIQVLYTFNDFNVSTILANGVLFDTIASPPYWTNFSVDLDTLGLQNQTVNIVFRHYGNDQFILGLDNIRIDINDPTKVIDTRFNELSIYPNPCNNIININGLEKTSTYQLFNLQGKLVQRGVCENKIITNLKRGIYILKIEEESLKVIIE